MNAYLKTLYSFISVIILFYFVSINTLIFKQRNGYTTSALYANNTIIENKAGLEKITFKLLEYIINKNTDGILDLVPKDHQIEVSIDEYMGYDELKKEFVQRGDIYNFLFDSDKFNSKIKTFDPGHKPRLCIRDQILDKKVKILDFNVLTRRPVLMVEVFLSWDGKDSNDRTLLRNFTFNNENGRWILISLNCTEI